MLRKIKKVIAKIVYFFLPIKKTIVFESVPDLSDNSKAVFDEMLRRGLNKEYKLVWWMQKENVDTPKIPGVKYINCKNKFRFFYYMYTARCLVSCNCFLSTRRKGQFSVYLSHGTTVKSVRSYYTIPNSIDYVLVTSENVVDLQAYEFNFDKTRIVPLGFPRNDVFSQTPIDIRPFLNTSCKKVIVWYPTYRQHKNGAVIAGGDSLPIIHNVEKAKSLNDVAIENDVLIVLKPHFAQDLSYVKDLGLSNIKFIGDDFFNDHGINSYCFVNGCDALITDYSSIYFDFTLCNKPVAVIWEDIEEYKKTPGLINNCEHYLRGAEKLFSLEDLQEFVIRVSKGEDALNKERNEVMKEVNISTDGKNSERVVDFIMNKIENLRK